jgi:hypothetical protein
MNVIRLTSTALLLLTVPLLVLNSPLYEAPVVNPMTSFLASNADGSGSGSGYNNPLSLVSSSSSRGKLSYNFSVARPLANAVVFIVCYVGDNHYAFRAMSSVGLLLATVFESVAIVDLDKSISVLLDKCDGLDGSCLSSNASTFYGLLELRCVSALALCTSCLCLYNLLNVIHLTTVLGCFRNVYDYHDVHVMHDSRWRLVIELDKIGYNRNNCLATSVEKNQ